MSINEKKINNMSNENNIEKEIKPTFFSFSPQDNLSNNKNTKNIKQESFSEDTQSKNNFMCGDSNKIVTNFSTNFQTFSPCKQNSQNDENINPLNDKIKDIYQNSFNNHDQDIVQNQIYKKPKLSLKDSRTKLKELRDKLYPLPEEEKLRGQEDLLPVPLEKMNDEKYKILRIHNLKKPSLPEYKSCQKYEDYYKPFEESINQKNQFLLLKKKKNAYSNTKVLKLELNLKNKNKEKNFPLYKDQDIGVYEYWQVPLIESKVDEDNDSDEEQINLAQKVCELDIAEGIKYIEKNGIESLYNNKFNKNKQEKDFIVKNKSV